VAGVARRGGDVGVEDGFGVAAVGGHEDLIAVGADEEGAADTVAAFPWAGGDGADVADAGDEKVEVASDGLIVVEPEAAVGVLLLIVVWFDSPGAGGEDDAGAHEAEGSADDLARGEGIGADHHAEGAEFCFRDVEAVALGIEVVSDLQLVEFAVMEYDRAGGVDEDGGVVDGVAVALGEAGAEVDVVLAGGVFDRGAGLAIGDGLRESCCGGVSPAQVHSFGKDDHVRAVPGGLGDQRGGAAEVGGGVAGLDEHLDHGQFERSTGRHRGLRLRVRGWAVGGSTMVSSA